jgi:hypothetical protein
LQRNSPKSFIFEKICQGNGKKQWNDYSPDRHSPDNGLSVADEWKKYRQRNVRQRNNSRPCLFPIPMPNIPLPKFQGLAKNKRVVKKMESEKFLFLYFCLHLFDMAFWSAPLLGFGCGLAAL